MKCQAVFSSYPDSKLDDKIEKLHTCTLPNTFP